jgi:hypothetical protein
LQYIVTFIDSKIPLRKTRNRSAIVKADFESGKWDANVDVAISLPIFQGIKVIASKYEYDSMNEIIDKEKSEKKKIKKQNKTKNSKGKEKWKRTKSAK